MFDDRELMFVKLGCTGAICDTLKGLTHEELIAYTAFCWSRNLAPTIDGARKFQTRYQQLKAKES